MGDAPTLSVRCEAPWSSATMFSHPKVVLRTAAAIAHLPKVDSAVDTTIGVCSFRRLPDSTGIHVEFGEVAVTDGALTRSAPWQPRYSELTRRILLG